MALNSDIFLHGGKHPCYSSFSRRTIFVHKVTKLFTDHNAKPQWLKFFICRDAAEQQKQPEGGGGGAALLTSRGKRCELQQLKWAFNIPSPHDSEN